MHPRVLKYHERVFLFFPTSAPKTKQIAFLQSTLSYFLNEHPSKYMTKGASTPSRNAICKLRRSKVFSIALE